MSDDPILLQACRNPLCDRRVSWRVLYCCAACATAHENGYEIHESGPLGHSDGCNERHKRRSPTGDKSDAQ